MTARKLFALRVKSSHLQGVEYVSGRRSRRITWISNFFHACGRETLRGFLCLHRKRTALSRLPRYMAGSFFALFCRTGRVKGFRFIFYCKRQLTRAHTLADRSGSPSAALSSLTYDSKPASSALHMSPQTGRQVRFSRRINGGWVGRRGRWADAHRRG